MIIKTWMERLPTQHPEGWLTMMNLQMQVMQAEIDELREYITELKRLQANYTTIECPACGFEGGREYDTRGEK